ncbi:protein-glutamate O-methyltransferase CheR [Robbsia sp. KACC 23696]|uniref:CheR family methyltransferase n=1 Tax=Robbsia sp. KACC 23696 TaxID=3149231 RepID=UPI00325B663D
MIASVPRPAAVRAGSARRLLGPAGTDAGSGGASAVPPHNGLPAGLAAHIAAALRRLSGLEIDLVGARSVERAVGERIQDLIAQRVIDDAWAYPSRVEQDAEERQWLIEAAVVPETWFFRHRESFDFLTAQARQHYYGRSDISAGRAPTPLRIASVPCSTGEEPYSISMTLLQDGFPPSAFLIDAMDISAVALAQAEAGIYRPNAFRGCPDTLRDRFFTAQSQPVKGSPIRESVWNINGDVRAGVSFRQVNLVADTYIGAATAQGGVYDFIFCRNVLIYFDRPTQAAVIEKLRQALRPGGFLLVGPAEAALVSRAGLTAAPAPLAFAFHRDKPAADAPVAYRASAPMGSAASVSVSRAGSPATAPRSIAPITQPFVAGAASSAAARSGQAGRPIGASGAASLPGSLPQGAAFAGGRSAASTPAPARAATVANAAFGQPQRAPTADGGAGGIGLRAARSRGHLSDAHDAPSKRETEAAAYAEAERLANLGAIAEAMRQCQAIVARGAATADVYCLMGVLADAGGRSADAREHFRRALYMEANHAGALVQFAEHLAMEGDDAGAQRLMARARRAHPDLF